MVSQMDFTPNINIPPDLFANVPVSGKAVNIGTALQGLQQGQQAAAELQRRRQMQAQMQAISQQYPQLAPFLTQETFPKIAEAAAGKAFEPGMPVYVNDQTQKISLQPQQGYRLYGNLPREHALKMLEIQGQKESTVEGTRDRLMQSIELRKQLAAQAQEQRRIGLEQQAENQRTNQFLRSQAIRGQHPIRSFFDPNFANPEAMNSGGQTSDVPQIGSTFNGAKVLKVERIN